MDTAESVSDCFKWKKKLVKNNTKMIRLYFYGYDYELNTGQPYLREVKPLYCPTMRQIYSDCIVN